MDDIVKVKVVEQPVIIRQTKIDEMKTLNKDTIDDIDSSYVVSKAASKISLLGIF